MLLHFEEKKTPYTVIDHIPRIKKLSYQSRLKILPLIAEKKLNPGEHLVNQGDLAQSFYLIKDGYIKWEHHNSWGNLTIIDIHGLCEAPGELAVRLGSRYPASGTALTSATVISIPRKTYLELLKSDPEFSNITSLCLASRAHSFLGRIVEDSEPDIEHSLSSFILRLVLKFGVLREKNYWTIPFYISRKDLSAAISCRIETTIRIMRKWELSKKVISTENGIHVLSEFVTHIQAIQESESLYFGSECSNCKKTNSAI